VVSPGWTGQPTAAIPGLNRQASDPGGPGASRGSASDNDQAGSANRSLLIKAFASSSLRQEGVTHFAATAWI